MTRMARLLIVLFVLVLPAAASAQSLVGVLGIPAEIGPVEDRLQNRTERSVRGHVFRLGTIDGQRVVVARTAPGKVNAAIVTTLLLDHFNPSALFFSGTADWILPCTPATSSSARRPHSMTSGGRPRRGSTGAARATPSPVTSIRW